MEVSILGSTGSIGVQTLEVIENLEGFSVAAISGGRNTELLERQARKFKPKLAACVAAADLKVRLADTDIQVTDDISKVAERGDLVVSAIAGMAGLVPTLAAIDAGKAVALANKETLVCAGELVKSKHPTLIPVDSEHSAIFQCLDGRNPPQRLWLTASGGPFFGWGAEELSKATPEQALRHPNWSMGRKVTIDSATMFNKGLECIEAMRLFDLPAQAIGVVVHRQSIVHSLVEFADGALIAQCGWPDMRLPIQYALTYPRRLKCPAVPLDMSKAMSWTFEPPDKIAFPCLDLALAAAKQGDAVCTALNAADEVAVAKFLAGEIKFTDIPKLIERGVRAAQSLRGGTIEDLLNVEREVIACLV
ncbi:1-deoxy-D-xylulose 5-phosphate reductoisomerase [Clostridia bacterium]|nr:1-deoxy-D-xylulose 5-phosphate reductoisomerase [Clostridia bacterium]